MSKTAKQVALTDIPLNYITGENFVITDERVLLSPVVKEVYSLNYPTSKFIDGFVLNNSCVIVSFSFDKFVIAVFNLSTQRLVYSVDCDRYSGLVYGGKKIFIFYDFSKVLIVDTEDLSYASKDITINGASQSVVKVHQLNPQTIGIVTINPTTLFILSIIELLQLINQTNDITSFTYSVQQLPTKNIDMLYYNDTIYLFGDDGTSIMTILLKELVYIKTEKLLFYKHNPIELFKSLSPISDNFTVERIHTYGLLQLKNKTEDNFVYYDINQKFFYLSNRYKFLFDYLYDPITGDLYKISFTGDVVNTTENIDRRLSVKYRLPNIATLYSVNITIEEMFKNSHVKLSIEQKYRDLYNIYSYTIDRSYNSFTCNLKGDTFVLNFIPDNYIRLRDISVVVV